YGYGGAKTSSLWKLDLETWRAARALDGRRVIRDFRVSPDGARVAMITTPDATVVSFEGRSRVDIGDLKTGKITTVPDKPFRAAGASPYGWLEHLAWRKDGKAVAFNVVYDAYPAEIMVAELRDSGWHTTRLKRPDGVHVRGYGSPVQWGARGDLWFLGEEKARVRLCRVAGVAGGGQGEAATLTPSDVAADAFRLP